MKFLISNIKRAKKPKQDTTQKINKPTQCRTLARSGILFVRAELFFRFRFFLLTIVNAENNK